MNPLYIVLLVFLGGVVVTCCVQNLLQALCCKLLKLPCTCARGLCRACGCCDTRDDTQLLPTPY